MVIIMELHEEDSSALSEDWVLLERPGPEEELRLVAFTKGDDESERQGLSTAAATAALGGAAGLLIVGPVTAALVAAGTMGAYADPGDLSVAAHRAKRWVKQSSLGSIAECGLAAEALVGRAKEAVGDVPAAAEALVVRAKEAVGDVPAQVFARLSGSALAEREEVIQRLHRELEAYKSECVEEKARLEELRDVERHWWREQSVRLVSELEGAQQAFAQEQASAQQAFAQEQASAELASAQEQQHFNRRLEAAQLAQAEEVGRLTRELETTEKIREQDTAQFAQELEHHRSARLADSKSVSVKLADAEKAREAAELEATEQLKAREQTENELEECRRSTS